MTSTKSYTPSPTGTLYFAYGSNLSPAQMHKRLKYNPDRSSTPIAIARLPRYKWIICKRGYANVVHMPTPTTDEVHGVVYDISPDDERVLDGYEGVDVNRSLRVGQHGQAGRPTDQGDGDYNKQYLEVDIQVVDARMERPRQQDQSAGLRR